MEKTGNESCWQLSESTKGAERLFTGRCRLKVHSVYHQVVNLTDGEEIFSLHPAFPAKSPMSLVLCTAGGSMGDLAPERGMEAVFMDGCMILNGIRIDCRKRTVWDPKLTVRLSSGGITRIVSGIRQILPGLRDRGGFSDSCICPEQREEDFMDRALRSRFRAFLEPCEDAAELAVSLLGMGYGLTPSGDDFLVGLFYVLCIGGYMEHKTAGGIRNAVLGNLSRTGDLSGQFLRHACRGEFGEKLHALAGAVRRGEDGLTELYRIAMTGHSSGVDALNGMAAGWHLMKTEKEKEPQEVVQK